ncbi:adenosylcobinamide-phosphate synthase CbiB [Shewanella schlegeliana]|uniref:Cobalamin biosynthesis protein CobD n=1 Tax=Shewanella schlegeliana TaxID=190308 RepID=A0ABS1SW20_9GAMM|nr:adenosylcobinamide-phosphate synthase CbiB [Shewanella schlegeliana]MBL4912109.1 cobalamin biosynthesis protein [Shewanella schlegeliana]MCL1111293.1 adenosylcobinamide-phosphate synthase CbiB [Shewanella schlegeliana]GIU32897.1 cobalamin biosynthesis protein CobD [Shewanella schlegeliana]
MWFDPFYCAGVVTLALLLDRLFGELPRFHPLVGFGLLASWVKQRLWRPTKRRGLLAVFILLLPVLPLLSLPSIWWIDVVILYFVIGGRSLCEHGNAVGEALKQGDLVLARQRVGMIVSRKTAKLTEQQVVNATLESVLENGNDAVFGALFWFTVAGPVGAVLYRLSNTLDAMWGYKNQTYLQFGWCAAKLDDLLNYIPARLCALAYALGGNTSIALKCWRVQAPKCASPNGGPVMAAGAGSLHITMGGAAEYDGYICDKPMLGEGRAAQASDINRACNLVRLSAIYWVVTLLMLSLLVTIF